MRSQVFDRIPYVRRWVTINTTSPNHDGGRGTAWEEDWMITDGSAILLMWTSLVGMSRFLPSKEAHFTPVR